MITTAGSRSATARINGHMYFRNVFRLIPPVDPPTIEQTAACLGYAFKKWRVQRRCLISPSGGMTSCSAIKIHNFATTNGPVPKKTLEVTIFCSGRPNRPTRLVLDVLSFQKKTSSHWFRHPLSFCFALVHVYDRWLEEQKRVERGGRGGSGWFCCSAKRESRREGGKLNACGMDTVLPTILRWNKKLIRLKYL